MNAKVEIYDSNHCWYKVSYDLTTNSRETTFTSNTDIF